LAGLVGVGATFSVFSFSMVELYCFRRCAAAPPTPPAPLFLALVRGLLTRFLRLVGAINIDPTNIGGKVSL
jgi:hypothetical protein